MNQISEEITNPLSIKCLDLYPILQQYYNSDALNIINNHRSQNLLVQWNKLNDNGYKYFGEYAVALGTLLSKLGIQSSETLWGSNYTRMISRTYYYGVTCQRDKVAEASMQLINTFNDLSSKGLIRAVLTPLMSIKLVDGRVVVVTYIAIDDSNKATVDSMYSSLEFNEGEIPPEFV